MSTGSSRTRIAKSLTRCTAEQGFTLIELMVAVVLLLVVLVLLPGALVGATQAALTSERQNAAAQLAQEQIEELRGLSYSALVLNSALVGSSSGIQGIYPALTFDYGTPPTTWNVVAAPDGTVSPISREVRRRTMSFDIRRYVLWADPQRTYKKLVVNVSWTEPRAGAVVLETDAENVAGIDKRPPVVIGTFPYIGDAFRSWQEIQRDGSREAMAVARDEDGSVTKVTFSYKKNIEASFTWIGDDNSGIAGAEGYYRYSVPWTPTISSENQYNLRVIATDSDGQTSVETHPFFIDTTPPPPPSVVEASNAALRDPANPASELVCTSPPRLSWPAVADFVDGNKSFNMVIGYLVYRDEKDPVSGYSLGDTLVASVYGPSITEFMDATLALDPGDPQSTKYVRYRIKSLGRASYWRAAGLNELMFSPYTPWITVGRPETNGGFNAFTDYGDPYPSGTQVVAEPAGWSAVRLDWKAQHDVHGHKADLYMIYRNRSWDAEGTYTWTLVNSLRPPDPTTDEVRYIDTNLARDTDYQYKVVPVYTPEYQVADPNGSGVGISAPTRTSLY